MEHSLHQRYPGRRNRREVTSSGHSSSFSLSSSPGSLGPGPSSSGSSSSCRPSSAGSSTRLPISKNWRVHILIEGVNCASDSGPIRRVLLGSFWVQNVTIEPSGHMMVEYFGSRDAVNGLVRKIEDTGHEAQLTRQVPVLEEPPARGLAPYHQTHLQRHATLRFMDLYHEPANTDNVVKVSGVMHDHFGDLIYLTDGPTPEDPLLSIRYTPCPGLTIRHIIAVINLEVPTVRVHVAKNRQKICTNLAQMLKTRANSCEEENGFFFSFLLSLATLFLTVGQNTFLLRASPRHIFGASPIDLALFILATAQILLCVSDIWVRACRELQALWKPESQMSTGKRFYQFGSTYVSISLAAGVAYFVSLFQLMLTTLGNLLTGHKTYYRGPWKYCLRNEYMFFDTFVYFNTLVFLVLIIDLFAKFKSRIGKMATALAEICPTTALVLDTSGHRNPIKSPESSVCGTPSLAPTFSLSDFLDGASGPRLRQVARHLLDIGDLVRVQYRKSPPCDGVLVESIGTAQLFGERPTSTTRGATAKIESVAYFSEVCLRGEVNPVRKRIGDPIYAGTTNEGPPVLIRVTAIPEVEYFYGGREITPGEYGEDKSIGSSNISKNGLVNTTGNLTLVDGIVEACKKSDAHLTVFERASNGLTRSFAPTITLVALVTAFFWLLVELGSPPGKQIIIDALEPGKPDSLPRCAPVAYWLRALSEALECAVIIFLVACPYGLGLATSLVEAIGSGMAASRYGILATRGGEAMEKVASGIDCVVLDKTTGLKTGAESKVVDAKIFLTPNGHVRVYEQQQTEDGPSSIGSTALQFDIDDFKSALRSLEEHSIHPVAKAIVKFCKKDKIDSNRVTVEEVEEVPGKGIKGCYTDKSLPTTSSGSSHDRIDIIVGNGTLMNDHGVVVPQYLDSEIGRWQAGGRSIALVAVRRISRSSQSRTAGSGTTRRTHDSNDNGQYDDNDTLDINPERPFVLVAALSIWGAIRPEAKSVIKALHARKISVWMISGDNVVTARAVARAVGIREDHVMADVLPEEKRERIKYLQLTLPVKRLPDTHKSYSYWVWPWKNRNQEMSTIHKGKQPQSGTYQNRGIELDRRNITTSRHLDEAAIPEDHDQGRRATIAMVGDGIDDEMALLTADVGFAIGSGRTERSKIEEGRGGQVAAAGADFLLLKDHMEDILTTMDVCAAVARRVRCNRIWTIFWNVITVLAATGVTKRKFYWQLNPYLAVLLMFFGAMIVLINSLALRWSPWWLGGFRDERDKDIVWPLSLSSTLWNRREEIEEREERRR